MDPVPADTKAAELFPLPVEADKIKRKSRPAIVLVVPIHNEEGAIPLFMRKVDQAVEPLNADFRFLFVDDGSTDRTRRVLAGLAGDRQDVDVLVLSRNFGKEAALSAGLDHATGDLVITIDADLQHPPHLIGEFIASWREGADMVYGLQVEHANGAHKRSVSTAFYRLFNLVSKPGIPSHAGDFRLLDRRVIDAVKALPERNRFMKGLYAWVGFKSVGISFEVAPRIVGRSTFNIWRRWNFAIDGFFGFSTFPLRVWTYFGFLLAFGAACFGSFTVAHTLIYGEKVPGYPSLMTVVLFFSGIQLVSFGVLGEYIGRMIAEVKRRPLYIVEETIGSFGRPRRSHSQEDDAA
jgi:polyisoprenyl-phosphate glycosyltransferase